LLKTRVSRYLEWKSVEGTYVYQYQEAGFFSGAKYIHKVPGTANEALSSSLMSLLEKNRCKNFFMFAQGWEEGAALGHPSFQSFDPNRHTMKQVYEKFGLQPDTIDYVGHAVALYNDDSYLNQACGPTISKIKLYMNSVLMYGGSPFIYPIFGLGGLPEGFSRLSAIHRGTYMLAKPCDGFEFGPDGKVIGVRSGEEVAKCKMVICDPSYANPAKSRVVGRSIRVICLLNHPIENTNNSLSTQIIIPQKQLRRNSDIYISMVSWAHNVAAKDMYIAIVSATCETDNPEREIEPAMGLLGPILEKFVSIGDIRVPVDAGEGDNVFVTESYDATSHFESASNEVVQMWKTITGEELDLNVLPEEEDQ